MGGPIHTDVRGVAGIEAFQATDAVGALVGFFVQVTDPALASGGGFSTDACYWGRTGAGWPSTFTLANYSQPLTTAAASPWKAFGPDVSQDSGTTEWPATDGKIYHLTRTSGSHVGWFRAGVQHRWWASPGRGEHPVVINPGNVLVFTAVAAVPSRVATPTWSGEHAKVRYGGRGR